MASATQLKGAPEALETQPGEDTSWLRSGPVPATTTTGGLCLWPGRSGHNKRPLSLSCPVTCSASWAASQPPTHHHHPSQLWSRPQQGQTYMHTCGFACWVGTGDLEPGMTAGSQGRPEAKKWESRGARGPALGGRWLVWPDREVGDPLAWPE